MPLYRKKPVVIEALQWDGTYAAATTMNAFIGKQVPCIGGILKIETLEGTMDAKPGDWIIKGVKGEFYPCKPDIFEATYEAVED